MKIWYVGMTAFLSECDKDKVNDTTQNTKQNSAEYNCDLPWETVH